ncbi:hypothetical protein L3Q82_008089 [Scortum barcoo]|uniref:Uncharacterized protein n=1 Tax=Scortum barcoo TaxID=214431 RepID=A0ACB8WKW3_9TELE|nr:hypothetical protein L3Q82_008089 [Scortum barcoo]
MQWAPALGDAEALSSLLSLHSVRVAGRILSLWRQKLSGKERSLLIDSSQGKIAPNPADSFPDVCLSPELGDLTGPLLTVVNPDKMTVHKVDKKTLYNNCVKSINKKGTEQQTSHCVDPKTVRGNRTEPTVEVFIQTSPQKTDCRPPVENFTRLLTGVPVVQVCFGPGSGATWLGLGSMPVVEADTPACCQTGAGGQLLGGGGLLSGPEKVSDVVVSGVVIQDSFTPVHPLVNPARKITISNVPPFIRNEVLAKELSRFGQLVSPIKMLSLGSKSPLLKHVVCHRRQVFMVLRENSAELNLSFNFKVDGFSYMVFATSETMKCFGCGAEGHLIRSCPEGAGGRRAAAAAGEGFVAPAPGGGPPAPGPASGDPSACSGGEVSVKSRDQLQRKDSVQADGEKQKDISDEVKQTECVNSEKPHDDLSLCEEQFIDDEDMSDDELLKLSQKRKNIEPVQKNVKASKMIKGSKAGKPPAESESESLLSQEEQTLYSPADIKKFLQGTKGTRLLKVEDHFSDLKLFIESAKPLTKTSGDVGESVLTEQEIYHLKKLIVKFTRNVTRDMTRSMRDLEIQLVELQSRAESTGDRGLLNSLKSKKRALANLLGVAAEGALVRSRFLNITQMDAPSQFFLWSGEEEWTKKNSSLPCDPVTALQSPTLLRSGNLQCVFIKTYIRVNLQTTQMCAAVFFTGLLQVETEANTKLEAQLTPQELYAALMSLKSGKAPGIDGLPVDFYKSFWSVLGEDLLEVFNDCLERGRLPLSCRRAVITLLPKKGDLQELKNWRPVSLLCTDYKIMSKVLASRLREVMASIIHPDQTYCVPGRLISDNVTLIRDILEVSGSLAVDTGSVGRLFLGQVALGPSEHPVSAKGGGWTGSGPSSQQGRCLPPYSSYRDSSPDLQTWFGGVYPAASLQRCGGLRLGPALFLMDCRSLDTSSLPAFYRSVFSVWILLRKQRREQADSLYWLLQEPVLFGGFLDCPSWSGPTLSRLLRAAGVSTLGQVVELAGPRLDDPVGLAAQLGLRSTRIMGQVLKHWRQKLTAEQFLLLNDFCYGSLQQNCEDPFPSIRLFPDFKNCSGPLLELAWILWVCPWRTPRGRLCTDS